VKGERLPAAARDRLRALVAASGYEAIARSLSSTPTTIADLIAGVGKHATTVERIARALKATP
jgi:hypothetical protein